MLEGGVGVMDTCKGRWVLAEGCLQRIRGQVGACRGKVGACRGNEGVWVHAVGQVGVCRQAGQCMQVGECRKAGVGG